MQYFVVSVICFIGVAQAGLLTEEQKTKIMQLHAQCLTESGIDEATVMKARKGEYVDDPKLKKQIFCFNKKAGFQNEAGEIQIEFTKSKLNEILKDPKKTDELFNKCNIKKETPEETAFAVVKCLHEAAPDKNLFD